MTQKQRRYQTGDGDFDIFKEAVFEFQRFFGLTHYKPECHHGHEDPASERAGYASITVNREARIATYTLSIDWANEMPSKQNVRVCAFHEVCELLISEITHALYAGEIPSKAVERITHDLIRRLEASVFPIYEERDK